MNTLLNYPGAKWGMAKEIVAMMPPHRSYLEPFFGRGAVLFNKPPSAIETVNDIDGDITNFFKVLREQPKELQEFRRPCISPEFPYCPDCPVGGEYISESELESLAMDGECRTEWYCNNVLKRPPQSWCYVEERYDRS